MDTSIMLDETKNIIELSLAKIETIYEFVTPIQIAIEYKDVDE